MSETLKKYYVNRNARLIKECVRYRKNGMNVREATAKVATDNPEDEVSPGLIWALMYDKTYPYAAEAWEVVNKELNNVESPAETLKVENAPVRSYS